jgi:hypothetical protein
MTVISLAHSNIIRLQAHASCRNPGKVKAKKLLVMFLIFAIGLFGLTYVLQVNNITGNGYKIKSLKNQLNELDEQNKVLQISISDLKSINALQTKSESFGMTKAQEVEYLAIPPVDVAITR